jgi:eukaryotic-like serine/threonine-protein kinase
VARTPKLPYRLDSRPLGKGGYATVHRGVHRDTGQAAAIKRPLKHDPHALARFKREVELQSKLDHPNVMPILEHSPDGDEWYAMPLARRNLTTAIETDQDINSFHLLSVIVQAARGLQYAHRQLLVHRDVNPNNILEVAERGEPPRWVIADWGLVRRPPGESSPRLTRRDRPLGTRGFVSPEALKDPHGADAGCDVYSLGMVAHFALTNVWPDEGFPLPAPGWLWGDFVTRCTEDRGKRIESMSSVLRMTRTVEARIDSMETGAHDLKCPRCGTPITGARCENCGRVWD